MKDINYEIGIAYAKSGKHNDGAYFLEQSINSGNVSANNDLGVLYEMHEEYAKAAEYYKAAGCNGNATAILNLANLYENGLGVKQDYAKARSYYVSAAKLGLPTAYAQLAKFYVYGLGVEVNTDKALFFLNKGAKLEKRRKYKSTKCTCTLGWHYFMGEGVKKDIKKAIKYWKIAANYGNKNATFHMALSYLRGEGVKRDVDRGLTDLIMLACRAGYKDAICELAEIFDSDKNGMKNIITAGHFLLKGADKKDTTCLLRIAEISLEDKWEDYGWSKNFSDFAILDFLKEVNGRETLYKEEIEQYKELKEKYSNNLDWAYLETLPDNPRNDEEVC